MSDQAIPTTTSSNTWKLPQEIINLSEADEWSGAVKEWSVESMEILDRLDPSSECLCGHKPIRKLCHIANRENHNTAIVGRVCVGKFEANDPGYEVFGSIPTIMDCALRILKNPLASANEQLINFAVEKGVFSKDNAAFYIAIHRKRNLSSKQENYKRNLNTKLLYSFVLSARQAYQRLKNDLETGTAGPKLVTYAHNSGIITQSSKEFYIQVWHKAHSELTLNQKNYKVRLNRKIISGLAKTFDT